MELISDFNTSPKETTSTQLSATPEDTLTTKEQPTQPAKPNKPSKPLLEYIVYFFTFCFGIGFISIGIRILVLTLEQIYIAYANLSTNTFLTTLIDWLTEKALIVDSANSFQFALGKGGAVIISVIILMFLLTTVTRIACQIITMGFKLLDPNKNK